MAGGNTYAKTPCYATHIVRHTVIQKRLGLPRLGVVVSEPEAPNHYIQHPEKLQILNFRLVLASLMLHWSLDVGRLELRFPRSPAATESGPEPPKSKLDAWSFFIAPQKIHAHTHTKAYLSVFSIVTTSTPATSVLKTPSLATPREKESDLEMKKVFSTCIEVFLGVRPRNSPKTVQLEDAVSALELGPWDSFGMSAIALAEEEPW